MWASPVVEADVAPDRCACLRDVGIGVQVPELLEARDEKHLLRLQKQLAKYSLLIIDELGYVPLSPTGAELLFEVFSQRYERGSTIVTSNLPFDEWTSTFGSERLFASEPPRNSTPCGRMCANTPRGYGGVCGQALVGRW